MRELQEKHSMHSRNEIIEVLDEVNTQYGSNFKLKTRNIITTPNLGGLPDEDMAKLIKLDACPVYFNYVFDVEDIMPILKKRVEYDDKYTVINKNEPRGQSVAENGIPCTARHCVTQLNRLMQENYRLSVKVQGINGLLNDLFKELDENYAKASKRKKEIDIACAYAQLQLITEIIDKVEKI